MDDQTVDQPRDFKVRAFGKDVLVYSAGNALLLLFGFVQTLIIPKFLSVEGYGYWQLFMLYGAYVYILNLGFNEGVLVRWAGKGLQQIGGELKIALKFLIIEQLAIIIPLGLITYFLIPPSLRWVGSLIFIYALIMNLENILLFAGQASRQFKLLIILDVTRGLIFLGTVIILFFSGHLEYQFVIIAWTVAYFLFTIALAIHYRHNFAGALSRGPSLAAFGTKNIAVGIFILLGGFVFVTFCSLDRLMISSFFSIEQFAVYAFAGAVSQIAFTFIKAVADVLFPYLSAAQHEQRTVAYQLGKRLLILCWAIFLAIYFPLTALINIYLPQYTSSLPIVKILLCTAGFSSLVLILQINYYRLYRRQRQYLVVGIIALALAVLTTLAAIKVLGSLESVAAAIFCSFVVWYIINALVLKAVIGENNGKMWKDLLVIGIYLAGFWLSSFISIALILQMLLYVCFFAAVTLLFFRNDLRQAFQIAKRGWNKRG